MILGNITQLFPERFFDEKVVKGLSSRGVVFLTSVVQHEFHFIGESRSKNDLRFHSSYNPNLVWASKPGKVYSTRMYVCMYVCVYVCVMVVVKINNYCYH